MASFICPAICDPEPYGITSDAPISYIARHNLMQVSLRVTDNRDDVELFWTYTLLSFLMFDAVHQLPNVAGVKQGSSHIHAKRSDILG